MHVVIMGAGAVGGYFGSALSKNGVDVTFVARGQHLEHMKKYGLKIDSYWGNFLVKSRFTDSLENIKKADLIILATKLYSNSSALPLLKPVIGTNTVILTIQNGISSGEIISEYYGWEKVLQGATYIETEIINSGYIQQTGSVAMIEFGEKDGKISDRCLTVKEILDVDGIQVNISKDISSTLWIKMVSVGAIGTLATAARSSLVEMISGEFGSESLKNIMEEIVAVGKSEGIHFPIGVVDEKFNSAIREAEEFKSSLQYDFNNHKPLELDDILGTVVRIAKKNDIPTPASTILMSVLEKYKKGTK